MHLIPPLSNFRIRFVVATRESREGFFTKTLTGRSLVFFGGLGFELDLYENNKSGLSEVYNLSIEKCIDNPAILVFIHDDVLLTDIHFKWQLINSLDIFDIVGVAGNVSRIPFQPGWAFLDTNLKWDNFENLSGAIGHGESYPPKYYSYFGPPCRQVRLLDGVMIACNSNLLISKKLRFDERFKFHYYDLDFCREAETLGFKMGTWFFSLVHKSSGCFHSDEMAKARHTYFEKWKC